MGAGQKEKGREEEENEKLGVFAEASILRGDPDVRKPSQPSVRVSQDAVEADDQPGWDSLTPHPSISCT